MQEKRKLIITELSLILYEEYNKVVVLDVGNRNEIYSFSNVAKIVETSILEREKIEEDDK